MAEKEFLPEINSPADVRKLNTQELEQLAGEIRAYLLDVVSKNGGHLAPNLGVVELTLALHKVFDLPKDKLIFDVGHQSYVHKILTGRRESFKTLRQHGGISGFPKPSESEYDAFGTGHSSTSVSAALGMAVARDLHKEDYHVVAVIGDGAMTGGMAFEALNHAGNAHTNLIVVLNDNEMSIAKNVGAVSEYLSALRTGKIYNSVKDKLESLLQGAELGENVLHLVRRVKGSLKYLLVPTSIFEELGFTYLGPVDGHDLSALTEVLEGAKKLRGPVLIHVLTKKGKGYKPAEDNPAAFHGTGPFNKETGKVLATNPNPTYSQVFGSTLVELAEADENIVALTAAMPGGTGLTDFAKKFPDRYFDVGIAEQHEVTLAAGMAINGLNPVVAVYSTFMQRAYDNVLHDVCLQNLHITLCLDRAGLVYDGATHCGAFDYAFLRSIPNMTIMAPKNENELRSMLKTAVALKGPVSVRYPALPGEGVEMTEAETLPVGKAEVLRKGKQLSIWAIGTMVQTALTVAEKLQAEGIEAGVVNMRFAKPLDEELLIQQAKAYDHILTLEEGVLKGGVGSAVLEVLNENDLLQQCRVLTLGLPDKFGEAGDRQLQLQDVGLDVDSVLASVKKWLKQD